MDLSLHYENVFLKPNFNSVQSRAEIDTDVMLGSRAFKLPVIPANMKCCIDADTCKLLDSHGYFYIMHRFDEDINNFIRFANLQEFNTISISVGIQQKDKNLVASIAQSLMRVDFITIDVAHGHHSKVADQIKHIKQ